MSSLSGMFQGLKHRLKENRQPGAVGAAAAIFLGLLFLMSGTLGRGLNHLSYDLPFLLRIPFHSPAPIPEVAIVYMDDHSHKELHQPWMQPWNRDVHAQLIEKMTEWGAKAVVIDVLFDTPGTNDQRLIQAARTNGRVILGGAFLPQTYAGKIIGWKGNPPFEELRNVVKWGVAEAAGSDRVINQHFRGDFKTTTMIWRAAEMTLPAPLPEQFAPRWVNYYGPPLVLPYYSYADVLSNNIPAATFSNKVVFVGARYTIGYTGGTGATGTDDFRTPFTRWYGTKSPGVEINATTYLNLRRGDWLTELSPMSEFLLVLFAGALLGFGLVLCRPTIAAAVGLGAFLLLMVMACLGVWRGHVWFPWMTIGGVQIPVTLGWSLLTNVKKLYREKEQLEVRLATKGGGPPVEPGFDANAPTAIARTRVTGNVGEDLPPPIPDHQMIRRIGKGAYGEVWLARDEIGTYHAVKIIFRKSFGDNAPFDREFRGIQQYTPISRTHRGLVHILHVGRNHDAGYFFYIMELGDCEISGTTVVPETYCAKNLQRELVRRDKLPIQECLELAMNLAEALHYLHSRQLIHRDIKPSNIIFVNGISKFADVGLVTHIAEKGRDVTYLGTEGFIAPEGPGTPAADVFSLGKVIYETCRGRDAAPFPELPTTLMPQGDGQALLQLNEIVIKACEPDTRRRYKSAAELHADLMILRTKIS